MNVAGMFQFGTLIMGHTSEAICGELGYNGNNNDYCDGGTINTDLYR